MLQDKVTYWGFVVRALRTASVIGTRLAMNRHEGFPLCCGLRGGVCLYIAGDTGH